MNDYEFQLAFFSMAAVSAALLMGLALWLDDE